MEDLLDDEQLQSQPLADRLEDESDLDDSVLCSQIPIDPAPAAPPFLQSHPSAKVLQLSAPRNRSHGAHGVPRTSPGLLAQPQKRSQMDPNIKIKAT